VATVHFEVIGKVQGVGFRWFVREAARRTDVAGWVRNRPDGGVEIAAAGSDRAVAELLDAVRIGPAGARVDQLRELSADDFGELPRPFTVLR
jgi:acylphosphatase